MKRQQFITLLFFVLLAIVATSCHDEPQFDNSPQGNFEALWTILDEHYSFFDYKDIDWNEVHDRYAKRVNPTMTSQELFDLCGTMLKELRDGHTNLIAAHDVSRYWIWEQYPVNYDERIIDENYLHFDYHKASGVKYQILSDNIGYMYYGDFTASIGEGNLDLILSYLSTCDGLIIDVRSNGGGYLTNVETLVGRFINDRIHAGTITHKNGRGHNDFASPYEYYFEPTKNHIHYLKPVVILANRGSFSATNNFVAIMQSLPQVTIIGDTTGGGSGLPFTSELPNGWNIRFSACPIADPQGRITEFGTPPDIHVDQTTEDTAAGHDTILDHAIALLAHQSDS